MGSGDEDQLEISGRTETEVGTPVMGVVAMLEL
jgi:hypothetical protein